jgi:HAD superfamily hydrolase (TIGR01509 family)
MRSGRVILFDLGGVLIENTGEQGLRALLPYELDRQELWDRWLTSDAVKQFERGRITPEIFAAQFVEEWRIELAPAAFIEAFATWPKGLFDGAESLLRKLRVRHHVGCLSNNNPVHWARFPGLPELFDSNFVSHVTGFVKPDPEAFEHAIRELGVKAEAILFLDDLPQNVDAARAAGLKAIQVKAFAEIEPALRAQGLYG